MIKNKALIESMSSNLKVFLKKMANPSGPGKTPVRDSDKFSPLLQTHRLPDGGADTKSEDKIPPATGQAASAYCM